MKLTIEDTDVYFNLFMAKNSLFTIEPISIPENIESVLKRLFWGKYKEVLKERQREPITGKKEVKILADLFYWSVSSVKFEGDLNKGIMLISNQGFGKDVLLTTINRFFNLDEKNFKEFRYNEFCSEWFEKSEDYFIRPIKINDITPTGRMKREKTSIPFLEFLDFREQINKRRGLLCSTNFLPIDLSNGLEYDQDEKRLVERIKECFNVFVIWDTISKRIENKIEI